MGLIAVDKLNRKVLGYLCRNNDVLAYCCSTCDIEFKQSNDLEAHMDHHELKSDIPSDPLEIIVVTPGVEDIVSHNGERNDANDVEIDGEDANADNDDDAQPNEENPNFNLDTSLDNSNTSSDIDETIMPNDTAQHTDLKRCSVSLIRCDELAKAMEALGPPVMESNDDESEQEEDDRNVREISPEEYDSDISELIRPQKFECNKCTASYSSDRRLQCHIQRVHPNHVCVMCGEIFKASIHLVSHQRKHQALAKELVFPCNICGDNVTDVKKHMDMHRARNDKISASNGLVLKAVNGKRPAPKRQQRLAKLARLSVESDKGGKIGGKPMVKIEKSCPILVGANGKIGDDAIGAPKKAPKLSSTPFKVASKFKIEANSTTAATTTPQILSNDNGSSMSRNKFCPICNMKFTKRARLIQHIKIHNGNYVECALCPNKILKKNYMPVHMKKYHNSEVHNTDVSLNGNGQSDPILVANRADDTNGSMISTNQSIQSDLFIDNSVYTEYLHDDNSQITEYDYLEVTDDNMHESMHVEQAILSAINTDDNASSDNFPENIASPTTDSMRLAMESSLLCNFRMN